MGEEVREGVHHFIVWDWREARRTQEDMLASWSRDEMISSLWGGRERIWERLEKSWVVEGPITVDDTQSAWQLKTGLIGSREVELEEGEEWGGPYRLHRPRHP